MFKTTFVGNIWPSLSMFILWNRKNVTCIIVVEYHTIQGDKDVSENGSLSFTLGQVVEITEMPYIIRIKMELF